KRAPRDRARRSPVELVASKEPRVLVHTLRRCGSLLDFGERHRFQDASFRCRGRVSRVASSARPREDGGGLAALFLGADSAHPPRLRVWRNDWRKTLSLTTSDRGRRKIALPASTGGSSCPSTWTSTTSREAFPRATLRRRT